MSPMEKNYCCEDRLLHVFLSMAIFMSSPAVLVADDVLGTPITTGSLPSIPLSLEGEAVSRPSEQASDLVWGGEMAFDWKAWAVVGVAGIVLIGVRLFGRRPVFKIPSDVFELLGEATLGNGQTVRIIRFGPKTLLVSTGNGGPKTLSELDDPLATEWIAAACRGEQTLRSLASHAASDDGASGADGANVRQLVQEEDGSASVCSQQSEVA